MRGCSPVLERIEQGAASSEGGTLDVIGDLRNELGHLADWPTREGLGLGLGTRLHDVRAMAPGPIREVVPDQWLNATAFEQLVQKHDYLSRIAEGSDISFHFPSSSAVPVDLGLQFLSFLNQLAAQHAGRVYLTFASSSGLFTYLDRNGFLRFLSGEISTDPPRPAASGADLRHGLTKGLVEISQLVPGTVGQARQTIVTELADALVGFYPQSQRTSRLGNHVFTVLGELVDNVFNHSLTELPGFVSLQAYSKRSTPRIVIAVSDSGRGIPESIRAALRAKVATQRDDQLIIRAFRDGLSSLGAHSGRGCGLPQCARLAAEYGSTLSVRTPTAHVVLHPATKGQPIHSANVSVLPANSFGGTHISLEFRASESHP
jgi:anti-sigma regulatory factor (Ser/Thr protein kinase)